MTYSLLRTLIVLAVVSVPVSAQEPVFPTIKASTLNKDKVTLPKDFSAAKNVLLISFGRDMQEVIDAWDAALTPLRELPDQVQVYNTPLIPNPGALVRGFINGGFRSIYKDRSLRDRIIILYVKEKKIFPVLGIEENDRTEPLILVISKDGTIIGRVQGLADEDNVAAVTAFIDPKESY